MQARDWFGLGARLCGGYNLVSSVEYLSSFLQLRSGLLQNGASGALASEKYSHPTTYLLIGLVDLVTAAFLLLGTKQLLRWTYGSVRGKSHSENLDAELLPSGDVLQTNPALLEPPMNGKDWFGLGLRFYGVYYLIAAVAWMRAYLELQLGLSPDYVAGGLGSGNDLPNSYLLAGVVQLSLGAALLLGAEPLARLSYKGSE